MIVSDMFDSDLQIRNIDDHNFGESCCTYYFFFITVTIFLGSVYLHGAFLSLLWKEKGVWL